MNARRPELHFLPEHSQKRQLEFNRLQQTFLVQVPNVNHLELISAIYIRKLGFFVWLKALISETAGRNRKIICVG